MRKIIKYLQLVLLVTFTSTLDGQILNPGDKAPAGAIIYSLPITTLNLEVQAECHHFVAGPYAKYAKKYLGVEGEEESGKKWSIISLKMTPFVEADPKVNIALNLGNQRNASANFLEMINQGLIVWSDSYIGKDQKSQIEKLRSEELFTSVLSAANLTEEETTLYRTVRSATGLERVPVKQSQVVEKSVERRAEETAQLIFELRKKRLNIITGDTDATFSGDALRAAVEEINRLEEEYLSLFFGKSSYSYSSTSYDIVPEKGNDKQIYFAFRLSESEGVLSKDNISGRPIVLELVPEEMSKVEMEQSRSSKGGEVYYRKPQMVTAKVTDGQQLLLQSRVPIYQLGETLTFPLNIATGRL